MVDDDSHIFVRNLAFVIVGFSMLDALEAKGQRHKAQKLSSIEKRVSRNQHPATLVSHEAVSKTPYHHSQPISYF